MTGLSVAVARKAFDAKEVLGEIGFDLAPGERAALLGPSGIGKSTLLSIIAGLDRAYEGRVTPPEGRLAMVFQAPRLLPWRSLVENLVLAAPEAGEDAARAALAEVGLAEAADQHPEKVSLGMQRRAALARALITGPSLLLMDEPLVSLDAKSTEAMRALLLKTFEITGATVLIATHDRREALALTDRILEIDGAPAKLIRDRRSPLARVGRDAAAVERVHQDWFA